MVFLWFPIFPSIFLWFSYGFPWFSYGFPMVFPWLFRPRSWRRPRPWSVPCPRRRSARGGPTGRCLELSGARKDSKLASGDFYGDFDGGWMVVEWWFWWEFIGNGDLWLMYGWFMDDLPVCDLGNGDLLLIYGWFTGLRTWKWWFITDLWMIYLLNMVIYRCFTY